MGLAPTGFGPELTIPPLVGGMGQAEERQRWTWEPPSRPPRRTGPSPWTKPPPAPEAPLPRSELQEEWAGRELPPAVVWTPLKQARSPLERVPTPEPRPDSHHNPDLLRAVDLALDDPTNTDRLLPFLVPLAARDRARFLLENVVKRQILRQHSSSRSLRATYHFKAVAQKYQDLVARNPKISDEDAFTDLILALHYQKQDHSGILPLLLSLVQGLHGPPAREKLLNKVLQVSRSPATPLVPRAHLKDEILSLGRISPLKALKLLFYQHSSLTPHSRLPPSSFSQLLTSLIHAPDAPHPNQILRLLASQSDVFAPSTPSSRNTKSIPLDTTHVDLVHEVALAIAFAPRISAREAYRGVMGCYKYLHSRGAGTLLGKDMSRAMAHAGLARNMQEEKWTSSQKLRFVLAWVRKLEGEEVARRLDEACYLWRGKVIREEMERRETAAESS